MATIVWDPYAQERIRAERKAAGADRWDEVWEGDYILCPQPNNEHQRIVMSLGFALETTITMPGLGSVYPGVNVSDDDGDWTRNYRCPDLAVYLRETRAVDRGTYWFGGPDFAIEILSPDDHARDKLPFYAKVGVRELLVIDRDPWALELYRNEGKRLAPAGRATPDAPEALVSRIVPLTFHLVAAEPRPRIEVSHHDSPQRWSV